MKASFDKLINADQPILIDFSAEWCGPCKAMAPILKEVAAAVKGSAKIIKVDVDKNRALAEKYEVRGVPTFILFQDGAIKWRHSGMQSAHRLTEIIKEVIQTNNTL